MIRRLFTISIHWDFAGRRGRIRRRRRCTAFRNWKRGCPISGSWAVRESISARCLSPPLMAMTPLIIRKWTDGWGTMRTSAILWIRLMNLASGWWWMVCSTTQDVSFSLFRISGRTGRIPETADGTKASGLEGIMPGTTGLAMNPGETAGI